MNRSRLAILLLLIFGVHHSTAQISATLSLQKSTVEAAFTALSSAIKDRAADAKSTLKSLIDGVIYSQEWSKYWGGYVLADPVTGPMASKVANELTASGQALLSSIVPVQDNITAAFDAVAKAISPTLTPNLTATLNAIDAANSNITTQFSTTTSSKMLTCWWKYVGTPTTIVSTASSALQTFFNDEKNAFARTLTAISDYAQLAGNNFRSMGTSADYCNGIGLSRPDLKNRTIACLQSLLEYAIPQLNADLAYQQDIVVQLATTEAGNSINRIISGITSVAEQAITAARMLPDDVANCFKTGV